MSGVERPAEAQGTLASSVAASDGAPAQQAHTQQPPTTPPEEVEQDTSQSATAQLQPASEDTEQTRPPQPLPGADAGQAAAPPAAKGREYRGKYRGLTYVEYYNLNREREKAKQLVNRIHDDAFFDVPPEYVLHWLERHNYPLSSKRNRKREKLIIADWTALLPKNVLPPGPEADA